jgi:2-polyprenyl-3-methyl-5-hydroxy-6-metoxy-1,4-benzoquinol methylase
VWIDNIRFEHFDTLGIDFKDKTILELGAGIGNHTKFLLSKMPKKIIAVEGREDNLEVLAKRFLNDKNITPVLFDLEKTMSFPDEKFDWIYNYGLLYHLKNPFEFIKSLSSINHNAMILETCIELKGDENVLEEGVHQSQALSGKGSRPNLYKLVDLLKKYYSKVYYPTQPTCGFYDIHHEPAYDLKRIVIICEK